MMKTNGCCPVCYKTLLNKGNVLAESFASICIEYSTMGKLTVRGGILGKGHTIIRYLENLGYIVTTEYDEWTLSVKPQCCGHNPNTVA